MASGATNSDAGRRRAAPRRSRRHSTLGAATAVAIALLVLGTPPAEASRPGPLRGVTERSAAAPAERTEPPATQPGAEAESEPRTEAVDAPAAVASGDRPPVTSARPRGQPAPVTPQGESGEIGPEEPEERRAEARQRTPAERRDDEEEREEVDPSGERVWPLRAGDFDFTQAFGCVAQIGGFYRVAPGCPREAPGFHTGIDLAAPTGTRFYAAASGWVQEAGLDREVGLANTRIVIQHDGPNADYATEYLHWVTTYVRPGDHVRAGQPIGEVGSVGYSTGPHLHFGVIDFDTGEHLDPFSWLPRDRENDAYLGLEPGSREITFDDAPNRAVPDYADPSPPPVPRRERVPKAPRPPDSSESRDRAEGGHQDEKDEGSQGKRDPQDGRDERKAGDREGGSGDDKADGKPASETDGAEDRGTDGEDRGEDTGDEGRDEDAGGSSDEGSERGANDDGTGGDESGDPAGNEGNRKDEGSDDEERTSDRETPRADEPASEGSDPEADRGEGDRADNRDAGGNGDGSGDGDGGGSNGDAGGNNGDRGGGDGKRDEQKASDNESG